MPSVELYRIRRLALGSLALSALSPQEMLIIHGTPLGLTRGLY